ncbi:MAG: dTMP kinase [Patescibacteria group bacterium]|nr:dTMP kinase [Patescibacteria group bacterium]
MKMKGKFIVFEGQDGSGNSTQSKIISDWLEGMSFPVLLTKEPTSNIIGGLIKGQLSHDWKTSPECLQLLFAADRAHHLEKEIIPALKKGYIVVCDRYLFSSIAYGTASGLSFKWLLEINKNFILPDITFLLKTPPKICLKRIERGRLTIELFEKEKKLSSVWKVYSLIAKKFKNIHIIDGEGSIDSVSKRIKNVLTRHIFLWKKR